MTQLLEKAFRAAKALPEAEQDALAASILADLEDECRWTDVFARSPDTLSTLADEARAEHVALIAADELSSLQETAHLLRSPANAVRLLSALRRVQQRSLAPQRIELLRHEAGLDPAE